jgi:hypothetical protein
MTSKTKDKAFRDLHESLTEWTCQYCKEVATTVRHGTAVCSHHSNLWTIGTDAAKLEATPIH